MKLSKSFWYLAGMMLVAAIAGSGVALGFVCKGSIGDFVWYDTNANGIQDDGEPGVNGVTVNLYSSSLGDWVLKATTVTANHWSTGQPGAYRFTYLPVGEYYLEFVAPSGYTWTVRDAGDNAKDSDVTAQGQTDNILLQCSQQDMTWDAGLVKCEASVGDYVWLDANKNGLQDDGESGVGGVQVTLYALVGGTWQVVGTQSTSDAGAYLFTGLPVGEYRLEFVAPSGYQWTNQNAGDEALDSDVDASGATASFSLGCNQVDLTWDAGLVQQGPDESITIEKTGAKVGGNCKTIGFWKTNVEKHLQGKTKGTQVSRADLLSWLRAVRAFYLPNPFQSQLDNSSDQALLSSALKVFNYTGSDIVKKTLRQLLACELNYVSGTYAMSSLAAHEALLKATEDALQNPGPALYALHDELDRVNNLGESSSSSTIYVGDVVAYTITVSAQLAAPREIEVRDCLDSSLQVLSVSNDGVVNGQCITWVLSLPAGESTTQLTFTAKITSLPKGDNVCEGPEGAIVSDPVTLPVYPASAGTSSVSATGPQTLCTPPPPPPTPSNLVNCAMVVPPPPPPPADEYQVIKTGWEVDGTAPLTVGDTVLYTITVNSKLSEPTWVKVTDCLDSALEVLQVSDGGTVDADNCVTWYLQLPAGESSTSVTVKVRIAVLPQGDNECSGEYVSDPVVLKVQKTTTQSVTGPQVQFLLPEVDLVNCAGVTPNVTPPPPPPPPDEFSIVKSGWKVKNSCWDSDKIKPGDYVVYKIVVGADLNAERTVEVRDYLDSSLQVVYVSDGGQVNGNCVVWNLQMPAGESTKTLYIKVKVNSLPAGDNGGGPSQRLDSNTVSLSVCEDKSYQRWQWWKWYRGRRSRTHSTGAGTPTTMCYDNPPQCGTLNNYASIIF